MTVFILPLAVFFVINSTIGIIGNVIMVLCFFQNPKLRYPCHVLITLLCLCDVLNLGGEFFFGLEVFWNVQTTQETCFFIEIFPVAGASAANPLILAIGIDRLLAVYFPMWYRGIIVNMKRYILFMIVSPLLYMLVILAVGYGTRLKNDPTLSLCSLPSGMNEFAMKLFSYSSILIYLLVFSVYFAVYILLKSHSATPRFQKVFQSLAVTVTFVLLGWGTTHFLNVINVLFVTDPDYYETITLYSGIPVHLSLTSNIFVFYAINPDYRKTIIKVLRMENNKGDGSMKNRTAKYISKLSGNQII